MSITSERLAEAMKVRRVDQSQLAEAVGATQGAISKILQGRTANSRLMPKIAVFLGYPLGWLLGISDNQFIEAGALLPDNDDEVEIDSVDLAYGMGGTFLDTDNVEVEKAKFSRSWLRQYTDSPPELLFSAQGIGDSMWPTIHDRDGVIGDRSSRTVDQGDKIWAIVYGGVGMIKRLRPLPDGTVRIMSDNPQVSDELATDGDLFIVGRVAAIVRRV